jgi:hypothetical protein
MQPYEEGGTVKNVVIKWTPLIFAVLMGIQGIRCAVLAFTQPRMGWKMVYLAATALCGVTAYLLWRTYQSVRKSDDSKLIP